MMNEPIYKLLDALKAEYTELKEEKTRVSLRGNESEYHERDFKYIDGKVVMLAGVISDLTAALAERARNE